MTMKTPGGQKGLEEIGKRGLDTQVMNQKKRQVARNRVKTLNGNAGKGGAAGGGGYSGGRRVRQARWNWEFQTQPWGCNLIFVGGGGGAVGNSDEQPRVKGGQAGEGGVGWSGLSWGGVGV